VDGFIRLNMGRLLARGIPSRFVPAKPLAASSCLAAQHLGSGQHPGRALWFLLRACLHRLSQKAMMTHGRAVLQCY
jgi:hypothetical protein